jgi:hypothetical protein
MMSASMVYQSRIGPNGRALVYVFLRRADSQGFVVEEEIGLFTPAQIRSHIETASEAVDDAEQWAKNASVMRAATKAMVYARQVERASAEFIRYAEGRVW